MATSKKESPELKAVKAKGPKTSVKMTPEIRAKLMGVSVVSDTIEYVHEIDDVPKEFLPVFTIKAITVEDSRKMRENVNEDETESKIDEKLEEFLREHIVDWKNLYDMSTGEPYEYKASETGEGADVTRYYTLPLGLRANLLAFLYKLSGLA